MKILEISPIFVKDLIRGMRSKDVVRLQQFLNLDADTQLAKAGPGSPSNETNYYGSLTEDAVRRFQLKHEVIQSPTVPGAGRTGPKTRAALERVFKNFLPATEQVVIEDKNSLKSAPSQGQCFNVFGDFRIPGWQKQNLVRCDLSQILPELEHVMIGWQPTNKAFVHEGWFGFLCHRLVAPKFQKAFQNVARRGLAPELKTFDGCFNKREIRGSKTGWSMHSWGIAIDLNASENRQGQQNFRMSERFVECFENVGFTWGGRWTGKFVDSMHFQYATV